MYFNMLKKKKKQVKETVSKKAEKVEGAFPVGWNHDLPANKQRHLK